MNRLFYLTALICGIQIDARAQASQEAATLHEIVVTGERLPRSLSDTASSVVVITSEPIESAAGADRVEQLLSLVPNVQSGSGGEGPTVRGQDSTGVLRDLPAFLGGTRPRVTMQVDGRALSFNEFVFGLASVWDVDRIEVFRSAQTTTQGRNSIAGAIFIETHDPSYVWEGRARLQGGNYDTLQASGTLSGPLVANQLAFRIAGDLRRSRTSSDIADIVEGADPNQDEYGVVRLKLLAEPAVLPGARLATTFVHEKSTMPQVEGVSAPFKKRKDPLAAYGVFSVDIDSLTEVLDYRLTPTLESTTRLSYGEVTALRFAPPGLGQAQTHATDFSVEPVLRWQPSRSVHLLGGVGYLRSRLDQFINLSAVVGAGAFADRQESLGLFGDVTLQLSSRLSATGGFRYQRDSQDRLGLLGGPVIDLPIDFDRTFDAWLPKLSAAYDIAEGLKVGVLVQRAFNPGGTTLDFETGRQVDFDAEFLWNYELFTRASLEGGRITLGANVFYNDISGAQRASTRAYTVPSGATAFWAVINNVPKAESYGVEVEFGWVVSARLGLRTALGLLETRIVETTQPADPLLDNEFQRSPALTASAAIDWRLTDQWRVSVQGRHNSAYFSDDANTAQLRIAGTTVLDARASYSKGPWSVFGYARNVFDRFYLTTLFSPSRGAAGDPREYGVGIEARF